MHDLAQLLLLGVTRCGWRGGRDALEELCHSLCVHTRLRQAVRLYVVERRLNRLDVLHLLALLGLHLRLAGDGEQIGQHGLNGGNIGEALLNYGVLLVDSGDLVLVLGLVDAVHEVDALLDRVAIVLLVQELQDSLLIVLLLKFA